MVCYTDDLANTMNHKHCQKPFDSCQGIMSLDLKSLLGFSLFASSSGMSLLRIPHCEEKNFLVILSKNLANIIAMEQKTTENKSKVLALRLRRITGTIKHYKDQTEI